MSRWCTTRNLSNCSIWHNWLFSFDLLDLTSKISVFLFKLSVPLLPLLNLRELLIVFVLKNHESLLSIILRVLLVDINLFLQTLHFILQIAYFGVWDILLISTLLQLSNLSIESLHILLSYLQPSGKLILLLRHFLQRILLLIELSRVFFRLILVLIDFLFVVAHNLLWLLFLTLIMSSSC